LIFRFALHPFCIYPPVKRFVTLNDKRSSRKFRFRIRKYPFADRNYRADVRGYRFGSRKSEADARKSEADIRKSEADICEHPFDNRKYRNEIRVLSGKNQTFRGSICTMFFNDKKSC
jgi:hypothetical protein